MQPHLPTRASLIHLYLLGLTLCLSFALPAQDTTTPDAPITTLRVTARLVQLNCNAYRRKTHTVEEIASAAELRVFEDDKLIPDVALRPAADLPLTLGILFDYSGSEIGEWDRMKRQTIKFLQTTLRPGDRVFIATFSNIIRIPLPITNGTESLARLTERIDAIQSSYGEEVMQRKAHGGTRLWDTIDWSLQTMKGAQGRRALVIFTDGLDNASNSSREDILHSAQEEGIPFFGVNVYSAFSMLGAAVAPWTMADRRFHDLVEKSGGLSFNAVTDAQVADRLKQVADTLRSQFVLEYRPPTSSSEASSSHKVRVEALNKALEIRTRTAVWH